MEIGYLPSYTEDYPYVVCWDKDNCGVYSLYSVCDRISEAEADAEKVRNDGYKFLIIYNNIC